MPLESESTGNILKLESKHQWIDINISLTFLTLSPLLYLVVFKKSRNNYVRHANRMIYHDGQYKLLTTLTLNFEIENEFLRAEVKFKARPKPPEELSYSLNISTMHYNQDKLDPKDWKNNEVTSKCSTTHFYRSKGVVQFDIRFSFIKPKELHIEGPSFSQSMSSLFLDQASSDVKIICGEEEFPCHKFVLCSRSDVFKAMLEGVKITKKVKMEF